MSRASSRNDAALSPQRVTGVHGVVVCERVGVGSKSERIAVLLQTDAARFLLRRTGAHAFSDPELQRLVGKAVLISGHLVAGNTLIADRIEPVA